MTMQNQSCLTILPEIKLITLAQIAIKLRYIMKGIIIAATALRQTPFDFGDSERDRSIVNPVANKRDSKTFADNVDQDQTARSVQFDVRSTLSVKKIFFLPK